MLPLIKRESSYKMGRFVFPGRVINLPGGNGLSVPWHEESLLFLELKQLPCVVYTAELNPSFL